MLRWLSVNEMTFTSPESAMTTKQIEKYRVRLEKLDARLGGTVAALEDQVRTPTGGETAGGISNAPVHLADIGSEAYTQELGATLLENEAYLRDEVVAALNRIDNGTFGHCEQCHQDMIPERLDALPYTRHCVACSTVLHSGRAVNLNDGRPETWLGAPGHEGQHQTGTRHRGAGRDTGGMAHDIHAAGTPGGGTASGGLAGTNIGDGDPDGVDLEAAAGGDEKDPVDEQNEEEAQAYAGSSGGAVGGSPANKRARGGKANTPANGGKKPPKK